MAAELLRENVPDDLTGKLIIRSAAIYHVPIDSQLKGYIEKDPVLASHTQRYMTPEDIGEADIIFVMTRSQKQRIVKEYPQVKDKIFLLLGRKDLNTGQGDYPSYEDFYLHSSQPYQNLRKKIEDNFGRIFNRIRQVVAKQKTNPGVSKEDAPKDSGAAAPRSARRTDSTKPDSFGGISSHNYMPDKTPNALPDSDGTADLTGPQRRPQPNEPSPTDSAAAASGRMPQNVPADAFLADSVMTTGAKKPNIDTYTVNLALRVLNNKDADGVTPRLYDRPTKNQALANLFIHIRTLGISPVYETLGKERMLAIVREWETEWLPKIQKLGDGLDKPAVIQQLIYSFRDNNLLFLEQIAPQNVRGKTFIVRVDFNDVHFDETDADIDDIRLCAARQTIRFIIDNGGKVVLITHSGRPGGTGIDERYRIDNVAKAVAKLLNIGDVKILPGRQIAPGKYTVVTDETVQSVQEMAAGGVAILDNIRFDWRERSAVPAEREGLTADLAQLGDVFVLDGFPISHRPLPRKH